MINILVGLLVILGTLIPLLLIAGIVGWSLIFHPIPLAVFLGLFICYGIGAAVLE